MRDKPIDRRKKSELWQVVTQLQSYFYACEVDDRSYGVLFTIQYHPKRYVSHAFTWQDIAEFTVEELREKLNQVIQVEKSKYEG